MVGGGSSDLDAGPAGGGELVGAGEDPAPGWDVGCRGGLAPVPGDREQAVSMSMRSTPTMCLDLNAASFRSGALRRLCREQTSRLLGKFPLRWQRTLMPQRPSSAGPSALRS